MESRVVLLGGFAYNYKYTIYGKISAAESGAPAEQGKRRSAKQLKGIV